MGTNYYLEFDICPTCKRGSKHLHIGKSSAGWCFGLHVIPEEGINSLEDWQERWKSIKTTIRDEYRQEYGKNEMMRIITERAWVRKEDLAEQWYQENHAEPGPNNLVRHKIDGRHCIGHGKGTWDLITGEFS